MTGAHRHIAAAIAEGDEDLAAHIISGHVLVQGHRFQGLAAMLLGDAI